MDKLVYLDNNATTKVDEKVFEAMAPYFCNEYANPSSMYTFGVDAAKAVKIAREQMRAFFNAKSINEIFFTASGSEGANMAIRGYLSTNKTQFAEYSYQVDDKTFYSHRATPFDHIYPGEMFKMKYLKDEPHVNKILYEYPVVLGKEQSKIRGYIDKIYNNKAVFHYKFKDVTYERRQLLRESHSLKQGDSINIIVIATNPKIGIINY